MALQYSRVSLTRIRPYYGLVVAYCKQPQRSKTVTTQQTILTNKHRNFVTDIHSPIELKTGDVQELANQILQKAVDKDVMNKCLPLSKVCEDVNELLKAGLSFEEVAVVSDKVESLKNLTHLKELINEFKTFGFERIDIVNILMTCPSLMNLTVDKVVSCLSMLQQAGFTTSALIEIVSRKPNIIETDVQKIKLRISELKQLFKSSDTFTLLSSNPELLFCDMSYIHDRFNYVFHEMGITQRQMLYSTIFSLPMDHIHARHMFVVRAGFFKKVKNKEAQIDYNPTLDKILDPSDEEFARTFGGMTVTDYQAFKQLLLREHIILQELDNEIEQSS